MPPPSNMLTTGIMYQFTVLELIKISHMITRFLPSFLIDFMGNKMECS